MLTDKAKQDFTDWLNPHPDDRKKIWGLPGYQLNTLIVNWLDSVGIYVTILVDIRFNDGKPEFVGQVDYMNGRMVHAWSSSEQETRLEATLAAINHAIYLYNLRK